MTDLSNIAHVEPTSQAPQRATPSRSIPVQNSAFTRSAYNLLEHGWRPLPVGPCTKVPGEWAGSLGWKKMKDWSRFCDQEIKESYLDLWSRYPDAGVCVCIPKGIVWLDLDTADKSVAADLGEMLDELPGTAIRRKGAKGFAQPFRLADGFDLHRKWYVRPKAGYETPGGQWIEFIQSGSQVVLPPTIHKDTGEPYIWLTDDTCENTSPDDLPIFDENLLVDILDVIRFYGDTFDYDPTKPRPAPRAKRADREDGDYTTLDLLRDEVNELALANLDKWVPDLDLYNWQRWRDGSYKAVAHWRSSGSGRALQDRSRNLSIHPAGIKDFGSDETYSPTWLVKCALNIDGTEALWWLKDRVDPFPEPAAWLRGGE